MQRRFFHCLCLGAAAVCVVAAGCNRAPVPPTPLAAEQIAPELQKGFVKAEPRAKELVDEIASAVRTNGYSDAFQAVQLLAAVPANTKPQQFLASRVMLTLNGLLQAAQAQGDQNATATLNFYQHNK